MSNKELIERLQFGLENCRLLAARHRKEDWALLILGFCAEAGVVGSITRDEKCKHGRTVGNLCGDCKYGVAEHVIVPL